LIAKDQIIPRLHHKLTLLCGKLNVVSFSVPSSSLSIVYENLNTTIAFSCEFKESVNVTWYQTQDYQVFGECTADFEGEPVRICNRLGVGRKWARYPSTSCTPKPFEMQLQTYSTYLLIPLVPFVVLLVLESVIIYRPNTFILRQVFAVLSLVYSASTFVVNFLFMAAFGL